MKTTTTEKYIELKNAYLKENTKIVEVPSGAVFKIHRPAVFDMVALTEFENEKDMRKQAKAMVRLCLEEPQIDVNDILDDDLMRLFVECTNFPSSENIKSFRK